MSALEFISAVRDHLTTFLGAPSRVLNLQLNNPDLPFESLEIAIFNEENEHPTILSTCGLCQNQILDGRRMELLFIVDDHGNSAVLEALVDTLGTLSVFAATAVPPLNYGGMLGAREQLETISPMDGVIFFPPFMLVNEFHGFEAPDGSPIQFLWVVPIYEDEAEYADEHGPRELANLVGANQINLTDLERPMANVEMTPDAVNQFLDPSSAETSRANRAAPHEITAEQIAKFRDSNEVIINVGQRHKPKSSGRRVAPQAPENLPSQAPSQLETPPQTRTSAPQSDDQAPVRFNLETGERLNKSDDVPVSQRPSVPPTHPAQSEALDPEKEKQKRITALRDAAKAAKKRAEKPS